MDVNFVHPVPLTASRHTPANTFIKSPVPYKADDCVPVCAISVYELITLLYVLNIQLPGFHLHILIRKPLVILVTCYQAVDSMTQMKN